MLDKWIPYSEALIDKHRISKVKAIVPGGKTGQGSIFNGVKKAHELYPQDSVVLIHDGVRPLVDVATIEKCIKCIHITLRSLSSQDIVGIQTKRWKMDRSFYYQGL